MIMKKNTVKFNVTLKPADSKFGITKTLWFSTIFVYNERWMWNKEKCIFSMASGRYDREWLKQRALLKAHKWTVFLNLNILMCFKKSVCILYIYTHIYIYNIHTYFSHQWKISNKHLSPIRKRSGRRQWHPTPVLLPGKSHGWRSLVGCSPWGR